MQEGTQNTLDFGTVAYSNASTQAHAMTLLNNALKATDDAKQAIGQALQFIADNGVTLPAEVLPAAEQPAPQEGIQLPDPVDPLAELRGQVADLGLALEQHGHTPDSIRELLVNHPLWHWSGRMSSESVRRLLRWRETGKLSSDVLRNPAKLKDMKVILTQALKEQQQQPGRATPIQPAPQVQQPISIMDALRKCFRNPPTLDVKLAEFPFRKNWLLLEPKKVLEMLGAARTQHGKDYLPPPAVQLGL